MQTYLHFYEISDLTSPSVQIEQLPVLVDEIQLFIKSIQYNGEVFILKLGSSLSIKQLFEDRSPTSKHITRVIDLKSDYTAQHQPANFELFCKHLRFG